MADLNSGKGKFWGVDENVNYAVSFTGATKVAEKVKKGGTETKSDGYVVDAIDIDWGGLKLTTIDNGWSQKTVSSTEQNAGKGENTQGIHSTAYLLNKISSSFTQIYNQIGGSDNAADSLRKRIKEVETAIKQMTDSTPGQLAEIKANINKINDELADPGAAGTMKSILDTLEGFDKTKDKVKKYIDDHDKAILGKSIDASTEYTVYGVRKYAEEKAEASYTNAVNKANEYTNQAIGTAESTLIGSTADAATANTIWGAKNYANTTVKNSLLGASGDAWPTKHTIYGVAKYATTVQSSLLGASGDAWPAKQTLYGVVKYSDNKNTNLKNTLIGSSTDTTIDTHYGLKHILIGKSSDAATADTIWGAKKHAVAQDTEVKNILRGASTDAATANTIWGAKNYANTTVKNSLLGATGDQWSTTKQTIWGAKNYADVVRTASYAQAKTEAGNVLGYDGDLWPNRKTVYGVAKYTETLLNTAFKVSRIEENNEGILVFSPVI